MATAAILKKINPSKHNFTWHMIFLQGFIKFDQGTSEKSTLPQLSWKQKRGDLNIFCIPFIKLHETL
jgi:hypothetical protein